MFDFVYGFLLLTLSEVKWTLNSIVFHLEFSGHDFQHRRPTFLFVMSIFLTCDHNFSDYSVVLFCFPLAWYFDFIFHLLKDASNFCVMWHIIPLLIFLHSQRHQRNELKIISKKMKSSLKKLWWQKLKNGTSCKCFQS